MRWLTRLKRPLQGIRYVQTYDGGRVLPGLNRACGRAELAPFGRGLCTSTRFQQEDTASAPKPSSSTTTEPLRSTQTYREKAPGSQWTLWALIFAASAGTAYLYRRQSGFLDDDVINTSTFSSFTITKREQVSPTAFIITLRPTSWVDPKERAPGYVQGDDEEKIGFLSKRIQEAWRHGLWSVEIKQPQLQIARHYTPLPPLLEGNNALPNETSKNKAHLAQDDDEEEQADIRILVRRMDGGEMSNYLSRQRVGDIIWLRGPHLGFDVARRLGTVDVNSQVEEDTANVTNGADTRRNVVFLAGGTGIVPALQVAHKLLDSSSSSSEDEIRKPRISILWANRHEADSVGRDSFAPTVQKSRPWFGFWGGSSESESDLPQPGPMQPSGEKPPPSSLEFQIRDLKRRHGSNFQLSYFVDDEGSFIQSRDLEAAVAPASTSTAATGAPVSSFFKINESCTWHSSKAVELLPDDNDAARSSSTSPDTISAYPCTCVPVAAGVGEKDANTSAARPGVNLLFVSGLEGFIAAYAGAKRWHDGHEMQGSVGGLLGRLQSDKRKKLEGWSVLKL